MTHFESEGYPEIVEISRTYSKPIEIYNWTGGIMVSGFSFVPRFGLGQSGQFSPVNTICGTSL